MISPRSRWDGSDVPERGSDADDMSVVLEESMTYKDTMIVPACLSRSAFAAAIFNLLARWATQGVSKRD